MPFIYFIIRKRVFIVLWYVFIGWYMDEFGVESLRSEIGFVKITKVQVERIRIY